MWSNRQKRIGKRHLECTLAALALSLALVTSAQALLVAVAPWWSAQPMSVAPSLEVLT